MSDLMRSIVVDGVSIEVPEISAQVVQRAITDREENNKTLRTQVEQQNAASSQTLADQRKLIDTKDGEIAALKRQVSDMEVTPQKLDKMVRDRLEIFEKARTIMGDTYVCDGRTDVEIRRAVVAARYGEQFAKSLSDEGITGAFGALTANTSGTHSVGNLATALGDAGRRTAHSSGDAAAIAWEERNNRLQNAWRNKGEKAN
jgi:uncharacterized protein